MKCQKNHCANAATLHITEVLSEDQVEELHLCEICANKYLYEPEQKGQSGKQSQTASSGEDPDEQAVLNRECEACSIKFVDFRNTGRLGCPNDYQEFREELLPLLENIHGETRHCGKIPRRLPENKQMQAELVQLRKQLTQAVHKERYEEAASIRDQIRQREES
jgi:protein arginine kinase activator